MKPYLTINRLRSYVDKYLKSNTYEWEQKDFRRVVNGLSSKGYSPAQDENGELIYEECSPWVNTPNDETAYMFNKWGCTVYVTYDYWDGSPLWTISMPDTREEELENRQIFKETWTD